MSEDVKRRPRTYNSTRRQEQARQTRTQILDAARVRFLAHGYPATTIPAIAADAGVSVQTVYKVFTNKAGLVKALFDVAIVGDDEPVPLLEREVVKQNQAEPDPRKKLRMYAEFYVDRAARAVPFQLLVRDAASTDSAAAAVWQQMVEERLTGMTHFARHLHDGGHLRDDVTVDEARDVLWTFISAELWELLVINRRWTPQRYGHWMGYMLIAALLPPQPALRRHTATDKGSPTRSKRVDTAQSP
jgi:AcrR family transcriptional regulator